MNKSSSKKPTKKKSVTKVTEQFDAPEMTPEPYMPSRPVFSPMAIGMAIVVLIGLTVFGFLKRERDTMANLKTNVIPTAVKAVLGDGGTTIKDVRNLKKVSGVISFELDLLAGDQTQTYTSYITTDGKILFTSGIMLDELTKKVSEAVPTPQTVASCTDIKANAAPKVTAFVVSQCPYGLQMQRAYSVALGEQSGLSEFLDVKYIGSVVDGKITSMHGEAEAVENHRQICIREEQKEKYWPYVSCYMQKGDSESCMTSTGVDASGVSACMTDANRGVAYAQKDFGVSKQYNISSSPTLLVNNEAIVSETGFGGRTADALKSIVCCAAENKPAFCSSELSKTPVAASFSETVTSGSVAGAAANCN